MVKEKVRGNLIVISGPSGCGKGTICKSLLQNNPNLFFSVSLTTREPRVGDKEGVDYYFVSKETFEKELKKAKCLSMLFTMIIIMERLKIK